MAFALPIRKSNSTAAVSSTVENVTDSQPISDDIIPKDKEKVSDEYKEVPLKYEEPEWASLPENSYYLEVLKNGVIVDNIPLPRDETFILCGRLPTCTLSMEHASISRHHAIIQYGTGGKVFIQDLDSSHGTFLNKKRLSSREYVAVHNGSMIRFGESSRLYIFQGIKEGDGLEKEDDNLSISKAKEKHEEARRWENPVKTIREWFQENGSRLMFEKIEDVDVDAGKVNLRIRIPASFTTNLEEELIVEGSGAQRREAEYAVCLKACEELASLGEMASEDNTGSWEEWRRQREEEEEEEQDSFFDRTIEVGRKKQKIDVTESFESLHQKRAELTISLGDFQSQLKLLNQVKSKDSTEEIEDVLDSYMKTLETEQTASQKQKLQELITEHSTELLKVESLLRKYGPLDDLVLQTVKTITGNRVPTGLPRDGAPVNVNNTINTLEDEDEVEDLILREEEEEVLKSIQELKSKYGY